MGSRFCRLGDLRGRRPGGNWRSGSERRSIGKRRPQAMAAWSHSGRARGRRSTISTPLPLPAAAVLKVRPASGCTILRTSMPRMCAIRTATSLLLFAVGLENDNEQGRAIFRADAIEIRGVGSGMLQVAFSRSHCRRRAGGQRVLLATSYARQSPRLRPAGCTPCPSDHRERDPLCRRRSQCDDFRADTVDETDHLTGKLRRPQR